jgi:hypothetical protein
MTPRGVRRERVALALCATMVLSGTASVVSSQSAALPTKDYLVFVGSEGNDKIALLRFGPKGASIDHEFHMGNNPTELVGPHGVAVSPDGRYY